MIAKEQSQRNDLALRATYEADAILVHLLKNLPTEQEYAHLGALVRRVETLNGVAMTVLGKNDDTETAELRCVVGGVE